MALLDDLRIFSSVYSDYVEACNELSEKNQAYKRFNEAGALLWYRQSDDELIVASRAIEADISEAEKSIAAGRQRISESLCNAGKAEQRLDLEFRKHEADFKAEAKKSKKTEVALGLVWIFILGPTVALWIVPIFVVLLGVPEGMNALIPEIAYVAFLVLGLIVLGLAQKRKRKIAQRYIESLEAKSQEKYGTIVNETQQQLLTEQQKINEIDSRLSLMKSEAAQQKQSAMDQAMLLWATDMVTRGEEVRGAAEKCDALYGRLISLGTVPSEKDWPAIDDIIEKIASGRADDLKEALILIDSDQRHREAMAVAFAQLNEQISMRKQLKKDIGGLNQKAEEIRNEIQRQHSADRVQKERQHAQQMRAEAAQIVMQAASYAQLKGLRNDFRDASGLNS